MSGPEEEYDAMSVPPADSPARRNPLVLPVVILAVVAAAEAVAVAVLLGVVLRRGEVVVPSAPAPIVARPEDAAAAAAPPSNAAAVSRGKVGQRQFDSAGLGITVEKILHEPATYKDMVRVGPDERYIAMLVLADNNTGRNAQLFPSQFRLQDKQGFGYDPLGIKGTMPALEWRTLGNRETVRGYIDFVVPKDAAGLTLIYSGVPSGGAPIQVVLGE